MTSSLGKNIKKMILRYQGPLYVINASQNINCVCRHGGTKEPSADCPYCLGLGHKLEIHLCKGVVQESNGIATMRQQVDYAIAKEIFVLPQYAIAPEDVVIVDNEPFDVYQVKQFRLENNELIYKICYCTPRKYDTKVFMEHFRQMVGV